MKKGFTVTRVYFSRTGNKPYIIGKSTHYTYNRDDMVFYADESDEDIREFIPNNGGVVLCLKAGFNCRNKVVID